MPEKCDRKGASPTESAAGQDWAKGTLRSWYTEAVFKKADQERAFRMGRRSFRHMPKETGSRYTRRHTLRAESGGRSGKCRTVSADMAGICAERMTPASSMRVVPREFSFTHRAVLPKEGRRRFMTGISAGAEKAGSRWKQRLPSRNTVTVFRGVFYFPRR